MVGEIICFSGWGQKYDSCEFIFDDIRYKNYKISSIDYSQFGSTELFFDYVKSLNIKAKAILGWSLGGQLSLRLISKNFIACENLILIAPPFQLVKDSKIQAAMSLEAFNQFRSNFAIAQSKTLKQFSVLTAMNDRNSSQISRNLDICDENVDNLLYWLDELNNFSFFNYDLSNIGRTLYFHGIGDMIVHISQMEYFKNSLKNIICKTYDKCGHAPQYSNIDDMRNIIFEFISKK